MSLTTYKRKRNFKSTSEPEGRSRKKSRQLEFVVQQHAASHLHYDFRLEADGVLKSWAVPKGPSINPDDKRLAMMVEDHPYDYKNFEGTIPEGNYGAGNVIVWDNGNYTSVDAENVKDAEKKILAGIKKGHVSFILNGKKLKGEFSLIKLHGKQENAWLLVKKEDRYAGNSDILKKNKSVLSGKPLALRNSKTAAKKTVASKTITGKKTAEIKVQLKKTKFPVAEKINCMLADIKEEPFDSAEWIYEIKYDGYRALSFVQPGKNPELYSRNHISFTSKYPLIVKELTKFHHQVILDGEMVVEDKKKRAGFQLLQNFLKNGEGDLKYYVFDILFLNGTDLRELPLIERKELIHLLIKKEKPKHIIYSDHIEEKGIAFYKAAIKKKLEGIIAKKKSSPYRSGRRSPDWLKIKITNEEEAIICGITAPRGSRKNFGSLILGIYKEGTLTYAGNCGTGFTDDTLSSLYKKFSTKFTDKNPFKERIVVREKIQWMKPHFIAQVKFTEWTTGGQFRHPVFLGLRSDKSPKEVVFRKAKANGKKIR